MVPEEIPKRHMDRKYQLAGPGLYYPCAQQ